MYWSKDDYEEVVRVIIDIYLDYNIKQFPILVIDICHRLGVVLIPYSELTPEYRKIALKKSADAFYAPPTRTSPPQIYYNDLIESKGRIRYNIVHELKHYIFNENKETKYSEDMADFFARYFLAPIPYLIVKNISTTVEIIDHCGLSQDAANNAARNIRNRKNRYGKQIFENEKPLIRHLFGDDYFERGDGN